MLTSEGVMAGVKSPLRANASHSAISTATPAAPRQNEVVDARVIP
jgi:hypothetical protein